MASITIVSLLVAVRAGRYYLIGRLGSYEAGFDVNLLLVLGVVPEPWVAQHLPVTSTAVWLG